MEQTEQYRQEHRVTNMPGGEEKGKSYRLAERIVYYALGVIEVLLGFDFVLKATAANADSSFVRFINALSLPFAAPFQSIFGSSSTETGSVFEWSLLIAMLVYLI